MRRRSLKRGFVLLLTLMLILIAGLMLAGIARQSLMLALEATRAHEDLQRRWAIVSCQQAILARAETIFAQRLEGAATRGLPPVEVPTRLSSVVELGGTEFRLELSEEDAKVNLNTICDNYGEEQTKRLLGQLGGSARTFSVRLSRRDRRSLRATTRRFDSWGQVYALEQSRSNRAPPTALVDLTTDITLWGSGRTNVYRASNKAIAEAWRLAVRRGRPDALHELRREVPTMELNDMLATLRLRDSDRESFENLLTDRSQAYSLWVFCGEKAELHLANTVDGETYNQSFLW